LGLSPHRYEKIAGMADTTVTVTVLHARGVLDVDTGDVIESGYVRIEGKTITEVSADPRTARDADEVIELPELTLIPGLMDMEVNLFMGGPGANLMDPVIADPAKRTLRAAANALRTLRAGFTTVRNLGLFVKTGGYLLDVSLMEAIEEGLVDGCRIVPAGHAIAATGGHLDPTTFLRLAPGIMPVTVEEGVADGVEEVRKCVRYQIKHGAQVIKCCASGGVMSHTGANHAQHYSDEELRVIADEAHRRGIKVATHCHGDMAARAAIAAGIDCIEHGFGISDETIQLMIDNGTFLVSTTALTENWDVSNQAPELRAKAAEVFPKAQDSLARALKAGVKVASGSDAPAIWHGRNAQELAAIVNRGATPLQAIRCATTVSADLIDRPDLGRIAPEMIADIIGVPGDPLTDITVTQKVKFVMKDGKVYKR
jgi:imidazolonepropionase-like amidohydrolase